MSCVRRWSLSSFFATCMLLFGLQIVYGFIMGFAHAGLDGCTTSSPSTPRAPCTPTSGDVAAVRLHGRRLLHRPRGVPTASSTGPSWPTCSWGALVVVGVTPSSASTSTGGRAASSSRSRARSTTCGRRRAALHRNIGMTIWKGSASPPPAMVLFFGLLMAALLYLPGMIPTDNQTSTRTGAGGWSTSGSRASGSSSWAASCRLPAHQAHRRRPRGHREVALRDRRPHLPLGHPRHRPPLLLHRHARYWLWIGGVFSALEPLAFLGMAIYGITMARKGGRKHPNRIALRGRWAAASCRSWARASSASPTRSRR
jgi:nitric oxide reductase subunit B